MKKTLRTGITLLALAPGAVRAADLIVPTKAPVQWSWSGFYLGGHIGSAMGFNTLANPLGPSIYGDRVHSPGYFGGGQVGANWQIVGSAWVFGLEADASLANLDGTNTCYAVSGVFTSLSCRAHTSAFGTLTGHTGFAFGPDGRSLAYVKGGLAWGRSTIDAIVNHNLGTAFGETNTGLWAWGWTVGAGAEYAMSSRWSVRTEYGYVNLGRSNVVVPPRSAITDPAAGPPAVTTVPLPGTNVLQSIHTFKLGVNYLIGASGATFPAVSLGADAWALGWQVEAGTRYWYSSGRFQKDLAPDLRGPQNPTLALSRLTWDGLKGHSAEAYARVDSPSDVFAKGHIGGGVTSGGRINDEDWGISTENAAVNTGYTNTEGSASGSISYATVDAGYNVFRGAGYKVGVFAGYSVVTSNERSAECVQIALPAADNCGIGGNAFFLGEYERWQSLRLGGTVDVMLTPRWRVVADVAYLPYSKFDGQDHHPQRPFFAEGWGTGVGTQLEAFVSYFVTPRFSIGAGGRYWAMWTTRGETCIEPPSGRCPAPEQNMQYKTERFGMLFQAAYRWDEAGAAGVRK